MHRETDDPCVLLRECGLIPSGWQLVVAAGPPSGVSAVLNPRAAGGGFLFLLSAMVAGVFSRSARAGCVRAGRGG
jgi:hypothetical protein